MKYKTFSFLIFCITILCLCMGSVFSADNITDNISISHEEDSQILTLETEDTPLTSPVYSEEVDIRADSASYKSGTKNVNYNFKIYNSTTNQPINNAKYYFNYGGSSIIGFSDVNGSCNLILETSKIDGGANIQAYSNNLWSYKYINLKILKTSVSAPSKTVTYKTNNYFKATVKDGYNNPVKKLSLTLKVYTGNKVETYNLKTDNNGKISFNTKSLSAGTHKVIISSTHKDYSFKKTSQITVKKKKATYTVSFKLYPNTHKYSRNKLKTGDILLAAANSRSGQHYKGVTIGTLIDAGQDGQHSTKIIKGIVYYKNKKTGKIITKTTSKTTTNGLNLKVLPWINGYTPIKAKVYYQKK